MEFFEEYDGKRYVNWAAIQESDQRARAKAMAIELQVTCTCRMCDREFQGSRGERVCPKRACQEAWAGSLEDE